MLLDDALGLTVVHLLKDPVDVELLGRGRSKPDVRAVLGGNFLRVAEAVWG